LASSRFEVEDAVVAPAVFVVADQVTAGIGGEGGLAGTREAEEDGSVSGWADVGRAVHGKDALKGEQGVEDGEDGLLDLAAVAGAADDGDTFGGVEDDERAGAGGVDERAGGEVRGNDDCECPGTSSSPCRASRA